MNLLLTESSFLLIRCCYADKIEKSRFFKKKCENNIFEQGAIMQRLCFEKGSLYFLFKVLLRV